MSAYAAIVTRQTDDHVWFRFPQDSTQVELFAERGFADVRRGDEIVVDQLEPGLWFITDPTSLVKQ